MTDTRIAVVGLGPTGASVTCDLLRRLDRRPPDCPVRLTLVDPDPRPGHGYAFRSSRVLNMRSGTMSLDPGDSGQFERWLAAAGLGDEEYPARKLFGRYVSERLEATLESADPAVVEVDRWETTAAAVQRHGDALQIVAAGGQARTFDTVVLALGESTFNALHHRTGQPGFVPSPWDPALADIPATADVAIVATGLSAVDASLELIERGHGGRITCLARRRGLPKVQGPREEYVPARVDRAWLDIATRARPLSFVTVARRVRAELDHAMGAPYQPGDPDPREWFSAAGFAERRRRGETRAFLDAFEAARTGRTLWYYALDALASITPAVWHAVRTADQLRFLKWARSMWNEYRHSMPAVNASILAGTVGTGQLSVARNLLVIDRTARPARTWRAVTGKHVEAFDYLVDATGGQPRLACRHNPLLRSCLRSGLLAEDARGGIRVGFHSCRALARDGREQPGLYFVGPLTFGTHFYTNSFDTNRDNAGRVGRQITEALAAREARGPFTSRSNTTEGGHMSARRTLEPDLRTIDLRDGRTFTWRQGRPDDAELVWAWWNGPDVSFWSIDARLDRVSAPPHDADSVREYLAGHLAVPPPERAIDPLIGLIDDVPVAYAELWMKGLSPIAESAEVSSLEAGARGMHLIVADRRSRLRGLAVEIGVDAMDWQFDDWAGAQHCIVDPDVRNQAAVSICARLGLGRVGLVELPHKTANVMAITRSEWREQRPLIDDMLDRLNPATRRRSLAERRPPGARRTAA
jgi:uncharacterized NAD(P)/FAD-binding protein YdhS